MVYCDKHNDPNLHKPLYESKSGGMYCPNVERTSEDGKPVYCKFKVALAYKPTERFASPSQKRVDGGKAAGVNSIIRGWASAGVKITDKKIKEAIEIVERTDYLLSNPEDKDDVEIL